MERIATAYVSMDGAELLATPLRASWNPGGTYQSAFEILTTGSLTGSPQTLEQVYLGEIQSIFKGVTGYVLTLTARHANGKDLRIWIQNVAATSFGGAHLWRRLEQKKILPGQIVFALGKFSLQTTNSAAVFYSMPIIDARRLWIVDSTQIAPLLLVTANGP